MAHEASNSANLNNQVVDMLESLQTIQVNEDDDFDDDKE